MIVLIPASKVLQPAIEPIQCTTSFNNIKQIQYYYRLLINGSPSSMCDRGWRRPLCMSLCVSLHTLYYVPSYTLQGAWLLLGGGEVMYKKDQTISTLTETLQCL